MTHAIIHDLLALGTAFCLGWTIKSIYGTYRARKILAEMKQRQIDEYRSGRGQS